MCMIMHILCLQTSLSCLMFSTMYVNSMPAKAHLIGHSHNIRPWQIPPYKPLFIVDEMEHKTARAEVLPWEMEHDALCPNALP